MNHHDHVALIRDGVRDPVAPEGVSPVAPVWADVGSGSGAFTLALADLLGAGATIHSVDRDRGALHAQARVLHSAFPEIEARFHPADFTRPLDLPPLDGIVMANALHFVADQRSVVALLRTYLKPGGRFVLVEYDTNRGNRWVPHPLSFPAWQRLACASGFQTTRLLSSRPSRFLGSIYAALSE